MHKNLLPILLPVLCLLQCLQPAAATAFDRVQQSSIHSARAERGLLLDLAVVPGRQRLLAVGEQGSILYSDDGGQAWVQAETPVSVLLTAVQMVSASRGWAVGHDGVILHTEDGGESWQLQASGQALLHRQQTALEEALQTPAVQDDPGLRDELQWQLEDIRAQLDEGAMPTLLNLLFLDEQRGFVIGAYGALFSTRDGGQSWQSLGHRLPNPDRMHLNALLLTDGGRLLLAGEAGLLLYSDDLGLSWQAAESPYDGSFFALAQADRLYLLGLRGHLFSSADGIHWQTEPVPTRASLNGAVVQGETLFLLGQGGLVLRRQGESFVPVQPIPRYSYTAGVLLDQRLLLVGEGGIQSIDLQQGGGQ